MLKKGKPHSSPSVSATSAAAGAATAAPAVVSPSHCPYRQASLLQQALAPDKMRVAFFIGAGCPVAIRVPDGDGTKPLIPDIAQLTKVVRTELEASANHKADFAAILKRFTGKLEPNIEQLLSYIRSLQEVVGDATINGLTEKSLTALDKEICRQITFVVKMPLPADGTPYHRLAAWIGGIPRQHPVEVFTSNYDLLMEQALEQCRIPYFDGFVGSDQTFFDLASMEQDTLPARWSRLWKVHGSINWWRTTEGNVQRHNNGTDGYQQMIYPSHLKYDQSRRMPYLAMLDKLKAFFTQGQAVLVTCGYSFSDQHLNDVILQGLSGNPNAICFGLLFGDRANSPDAVVQARKQPNLNLLAADGAVLNTIERDWRSDENTDHPLHGLAVRSGEMRPRTIAPATRCKLLLGDFKSLGEFLAQNLSYRDADKEVDNGK